MKFWSLGVDAIGDDDDLSHVYLPNFKQLYKSREGQGQLRHFGTGCEGVDHFLRPAKHLPAEPSFEEEGGRLVGVFRLLFSI